jgi:tetratricopeptide (TPR) repeat protein
MFSRVASALVVVVACVAPSAAQRGVDGGGLLLRYVQGDRTLTLPTTFDRREFLASLESAIGKGLPSPPEAARRATAAFALEVAAARLDAGDIPGARSLLEWACARIRAHEVADEFDIAWHAAALSIADGFLDPDALEAHVRHTRSRVPVGALLDLSWAVAAEQRTSPLLIPRLAADVSPTMLAVNQAQLDAAVGRLMDDAVARFAVAASNAVTAGDARVRTAHIQLARNQAEQALTSLAALESTTREGWLVYLARLFRGQALERLQRPDDAITSLRDALKVGPGGQTATLSLSTLLYRRGQRDEAETLVQRLLAETDPISDPWWTYWAGGARLWTTRLAAMRGLLQ